MHLLKRQIAARKRYDVLFMVIGVIALMIGILTFAEPLACS